MAPTMSAVVLNTSEHRQRPRAILHHRDCPTLVLARATGAIEEWPVVPLDLMGSLLRDMAQTHWRERSVEACAHCEELLPR